MTKHNVDAGSILELKYQLKDRNYKKMKSEMFLEGKSHKLEAVLHGDARSNNMLFKYDCKGRQTIGVKLVDFQAALFFAPFFDLPYFLMSSVSVHVVKGHYMDLLCR